MRTGIKASGVANVIESDSFNRTDTADLVASTLDNAGGGYLSRTWVNLNGAPRYGIVSNQARYPAASATAKHWTNTLGTNDMKVSCKWVAVTGISNAVPSLYARVTNNSNWYGVLLTATTGAAQGTLELRKNVAAAQTVLATSAAGAVVAGDTISLKVNGSSIQVLVNGAVSLSVTDTALTSGVGAAIGGTTGVATTFDIDDFKVEVA